MSNNALHTSLPYPYKIVRKVINVCDMIHLDQKVDNELTRRANLFIKYNWVVPGETYPWVQLRESILKKWDPAFWHCVSKQGRRGTLHNEQPHPSAFVVREYERNGKILYSPYTANHRTSVIRALDFKTIEAFVAVRDGFSHTNANELTKFIKHMKEVVGNCQQYQSLWLPYNIKNDSRDNTHDIFHHVFNWRLWPGRTVLEVGCHVGMMGLTAKRYGADKVVGFDLDGKLVNLYKELSQLLDLPVEVYHCDFWDFPLWKKEKFDITMAHQCMYHFNTAHRCAVAKQHTQQEMLNNICDATKEIFWAYTFIHNDSRPTSELEGYRPTESQIIQDMKTRKFNNVEIIDFNKASAKRSLVAHRHESFLTRFTTVS